MGNRASSCSADYPLVRMDAYFQMQPCEFPSAFWKRSALRNVFPASASCFGTVRRSFGTVVRVQDAITSEKSNPIHFSAVGKAPAILSLGHLGFCPALFRGLIWANS